MCADSSSDSTTEFSVFCMDVMRRGVTVRVTIFPLPEVEQRWTLEVIDENGGCAVLAALFDTCEEAFIAFGAAVDAVGPDGLTVSMN